MCFSSAYYYLDSSTLSGMQYRNGTRSRTGTSGRVECKHIALFDDFDWMVAPGGDHPRATHVMSMIYPIMRPGGRRRLFQQKNYSGISFRKGAFSALAPHVQPHVLMKSADHKNLKTTVQHYLSETIQQRAGNTGLSDGELSLSSSLY